MLRGGAEHRELKLSQLTRDFTSDGLLRFTYTENCSKNRCTGFKLKTKSLSNSKISVLVIVVTLTFCICIFLRFQIKLLNKTLLCTSSS